MKAIRSSLVRVVAACATSSARRVSIDLGRRPRVGALPGGRPRVADDGGVAGMLARADDVERAAQQGAHQELAGVQRGEEVPGLEAAQARPERDRHRRPVLRLDGADALDRLDHRPVHAVEQALPGQQGPVQRTGGEDAHDLIVRAARHAGSPSHSDATVVETQWDHTVTTDAPVDGHPRSVGNTSVTGSCESKGDQSQSLPYLAHGTRAGRSSGSSRS